MHRVYSTDCTVATEGVREAQTNLMVHPVLISTPNTTGFRSEAFTQDPLAEGPTRVSQLLVSLLRAMASLYQGQGCISS